ncbi:MAG: lipoyl(octanoyl) transferase LipB [Chloroflexi bacterium]|nr:lipoyl(octanoyl) transferase LipB [Chloroflexota bacterium]
MTPISRPRGPNILSAVDGTGGRPFEDIPSPHRGEGGRRPGEGNDPVTSLRAAWLGRVPYGEALDRQRRVHELRVRGEITDTLLLLEHPHVYTRGRRGAESDVLATPERLRELRAEVFETDRGGQTTYHGPGQLVGYPILNLKAAGLGPVGYVCMLEQVLIDTAAEFGVGANRLNGETGVWSSSGKLAAIGVRISYGVTMHGFALNVTTDLRYFDHIIPCGIPSMPASSIESETGRTYGVLEVASVLAPKLAAALERVEMGDRN